MSREEDIKTIEKFIRSGGSMFLDGCTGNISDKDLNIIANNCKALMPKEDTLKGWCLRCDTYFPSGEDHKCKDQS